MNKKPKISLDRIKNYITKDKFIISIHARERAFQRNISTDQIISVILNGELIEKHEELNPCPRARILGYIDDTPYQVVVAECKDKIIIVTVYISEEDK